MRQFLGFPFARPGLGPPLRAACLLATLLLWPLSSAAGATYYVDNSSGSCSDTGPGTSSTPYCTITAAVNAHKVAGTTFMVRPGLYAEQVSVTTPGTSGNPIVFQATGPGAIVDGSDDFSGAAKWSLVSGNVWLASSVNWLPAQAFADGARLQPSTAAPASIPTGTFEYVSGTGLYVNVGGGNPGLHQARVGRRLYGFRISGKSYINVFGFNVVRTEDRAIYVSSGSNNCIVSGNTVTHAFRYGVGVSGSSGALVAANVITDCQDHAISLSSASTGCTVQDNECSRSADPIERRANGIYLNHATNNFILRNRLHDNQDSGMNFTGFATDNICVGNISWNNGDHGFDHLNSSTGNSHRNDVAYGNFKDGFSVEGGATGTSLYNCIAVNNGLTTGEFNLWVENTSASGFASNYNLFWNSTSQNPVKYLTTMYSSVAAYAAASGRDAQSLQSNPRFVNPAGGDFHLLAGSPAIDNALTSVSNWPPLDSDGHARIDDPATPNTGSGPVLFADRGALEYVVDQAPAVVAPAAITSPEQSVITFTVTASDPDGQAISSLTANLGSLPAGHNAAFTAGPGNTSATFTWTPTYADGRGAPYNVTFTASNVISGSATTAITVTNVDRAPIVSTPASASGGEQTLITFTVVASDPDGDAVASLSADLSALPSGHNAAFTTNAGHTSGTFTWTPTFADGRGAPYNVTFTASNALSGSASTGVTVTNVDRAPSVTAPATVSGAEQTVITLTVSASDPDGDAIASLTADLSALPPAHDGSFTTDAGHTSGTFTWTPTFADGGAAPYTITFSASNALSGSASTAITVTNSDRAPATAAPASATGAESAVLTVLVTASDPDGDTIASLTADLSALPAGNNAAFTANAGHTSGTLTWTPTFADGGTAAYNVTFTASNALSGSAATAITISNSDRAPTVIAPAAAGGPGGSLITFTVSASDPDADAITSLTADTSALPAGNAASFTANAGNTSGTFAWAPTSADGRSAPYNVIFTASNALSGSATTAITVTDDQSPVVTAPAAVSGPEGSLITFAVSASDPDGHAITSLTADLSTFPAGNDAAFTANAGHTSGTFTWTPTFADVGGAPYSVTFTASNALSGSATTAITVTGDQPPLVTAPATESGPEGSQVTFAVSASDPDGHAITSLTADLSALPAGNDATFTAGSANTSGTFSWTPTFDDARGTPYDVSFTASNALSGSATTAITVTGDRAPVVTAPATVSGAEGSLVTFTVSASDPDGHAIASLTADTSALPAGNDAAFTAGSGHTSGTFTWTPTFDDGSGTPYGVTFTASNELSGSATTSITVATTDRVPAVSAPATASGAEQTLTSFTVTASDPDGDAITSLTANLSALPAGNDAVFTADAGHTSGTFSWTPTFADGRGAPYNVVFTASNALSGSSTTAITVANADRAPSVTAPATSGGAEQTVISFTVTASDPDGDAITSLTADTSALPAGNNAAFTAGAGHTSGTFTWTPTFADGGAAPYSVTITASNSLAGSAATSVTVTNVDRAPSVGAPATVSGVEQTVISFIVTASDPDGDAITSLTSDMSALPAGNNAAFTANAGHTSGTFTWTPATGHSRPAPYNVTFTAVNASSSSASSVITVLPPNQPPTAALSVSPATGNAALAVTANASGSLDPDGSILSYRFDFGDGTIVGPQPGATATHTYAAGSWTASVLVTDNGGGTATATTPVLVASVGSGPNLVGNPSFESSITGWGQSGGATVLRVSGGFDGAFSLQMQGAASGTGKFGANDSPNWVLTTSAAGIRYRFTAWVRSTAAVGKPLLRVREYLGSAQQGATGESPLNLTLSPAWQMITLDYVVVTAGSTLDFQVLDAPVVPGEVFQMDNVSIRVVTGGAASSLASGREATVFSFTAVMAPNPLNPTATLFFTTSREGAVHVRIFDAAGRRIRELLSSAGVPAGQHSVQFDGKDASGRRLASGVYFYRVEASEGSIQGRMVVMK
jgi:hypothetical protein